MKKLLLSAMVAVLGLAFAQNSSEKQRLTPELLWKMKRLSGVSVSPDKKQVVYGVSQYKLEDNKGNRDLYIMNVDGSSKRQLTSFKGSEFNVRWKPNTSTVGFLSAESGSVQLWEINADGSNLKQVSFIEGGVSGFEYSPKLDNILYIQKVKLDKKVVDIYSDLPKANARIIDDLMYRHWDSWSDYKYTHIFVTSYSDSIVAGYDIMEGKKFDAPTKPFDGMEQITFSPDGKTIAYSCKKLIGKEFAESTNTDIYLYDIASKSETNLTEGMVGYDEEPVYSPSGKKISWLSMERAGFESDKSRIFIYDFKSKKKTYLGENFDQSAGHVTWSSDEKTIYFNSTIHATNQIFSMDLKTQTTKQITKGDHNYGSYAVVGKTLIGTKMTIKRPTEMFAVSMKDGSEKQITDVNGEMYKNLAVGEVEKRWITTSDNKKMLVWVILPPNFDSRKEYPALLYCQGGPQAAVSQFFSYRWNFQLMAANDYIVVAPNRRGLPSFGQEWNDQISKDYGGQCMQDYFSAIDTVAEELYVDKNRLGAVGASFGGYSVYWLAGNHNKRFSAFISHCGLFNLESWYNTTEELFFANYDQGGAFWKNKELQDRYNKFSPHRYIQNWDTPMLVIHGGKDFRVPIGEGLQAFQSAQLMGVKSRFLYFPTEGHWVLSPQNGVLWHRVFFEWLDEHLKNPSEKMN